MLQRLWGGGYLMLQYSSHPWHPFPHVPTAVGEQLGQPRIAGLHFAKVVSGGGRQGRVLPLDKREGRFRWGRVDMGMRACSRSMWWAASQSMGRVLEGNRVEATENQGSCRAVANSTDLVLVQPASAWRAPSSGAGQEQQRGGGGVPHSMP
jgi:hypothetical protein